MLIRRNKEEHTSRGEASGRAVNRGSISCDIRGCQRRAIGAVYRKPSWNHIRLEKSEGVYIGLKYITTYIGLKYIILG